MHLSIVAQPSPSFMNRTFYYTWKHGKPSFYFLKYLKVKTHGTCDFVPSQFRRNTQWTNSSHVQDRSWHDTQPQRFGICWRKQAREGDSQMTLLEWFLPGAAHLDCAAAKDKACALIRCSSDLKCGDAEHVMQHASNVKMSRERCWLSCMCVYVCMCTSRACNVMCSCFWNIACRPFRPNHATGPGGLGMLHGKSPLSVSQESTDTAVGQKVFVWD